MSVLADERAGRQGTKTLLAERCHLCSPASRQADKRTNGQTEHRTQTQTQADR